MFAKQDHDCLLTRWDEVSPQMGGRFIADGPLSPGDWESTPLRVLFLMKEAYDRGTDPKDRWTLPSLVREWIDQEEPLPRTWQNLFLWSRAMHTYDPAMPPSHQLPENPAEYWEFLKRCAVVNVKKSQGKSKSTDDDLRNYLSLSTGDWRNSQWLEQQVRVLDPHLVICCGTFHLLQEPWKESSLFAPPYRSIWDVHERGGRIWFDYWHPAWPTSPFLLLQGLHAMRVRFEQEAAPA